MKWMGLKSGLHAHFAHDDSCPWCRIDRQKMNTLEKQELRTLENAREAAHLPPLDANGKAVFPFTCKLCNVKFSTEEEWIKEDLSGQKNAKMFTQSSPRRACLASSQSLLRSVPLRLVLVAHETILLQLALDLADQTISTSQETRSGRSGSCHAAKRWRECVEVEEA